MAIVPRKLGAKTGGEKKTRDQWPVKAVIDPPLAGEPVPTMPG